MRETLFQLWRVSLSTFQRPRKREKIEKRDWQTQAKGLLSGRRGTPCDESLVFCWWGPSQWPPPAPRTFFFSLSLNFRVLWDLLCLDGCILLITIPIKQLFKIYLNIKFIILIINFLKFVSIILSTLHPIFINFQ